MVFADDETSGSGTDTDTSEQEDASVTSLGCHPSFASTSTSTGGDPIRQAVQAQGFLGTTADIICESWRNTTKQQYASYLKRWKQFCVARNCDTFRPTVTLLLQFLTDLFQQGLSYSAINTARSAISAVYFCGEEHGIGAHPLVSRFMKGVFEMRTPLPRYKCVWDVNTLLQYFKQQKANEDLSLKLLTRKLCALLLLTTAQRVQTIHVMRLSCICFDSAGCSVQIIDKLKHTRQGHHQSVLKLPRFPQDKKLCVIECLNQYIHRTRRIRGSNDQLLLCYVQPYGPASKDTISRWLKKVLSDAGIDNFSPHSFRGAAASAMLKSGISVDHILKTAGWSNASTFHKFYNKPMVEKQLAAKKTDYSIKHYFQPLQK